MSQSLVKTIADFSTTLAVKLTAASTTGTLTSGLDADGIQLPTGTYGFTVDRGTSDKEYFTATLTGTALTAIKTVTRGTGLGTSGIARTHRKGAEVIISDHVALKRMMNVLDGTTDLDASTPLKYDGTATISNSNHLATKKYVDDTASAGAPLATASVKGIAKLSVAPASPTAPIAVGDNDTRLPSAGQAQALVGSSGAPSTSNKYVTETDPNFTGTVKTSGDQTVAGVKTFSSIPVLPASDPTTSNQAARKSYADGLVATTSGSVVDGGTTIYYQKRGNKLYYGLYADSGSRFNADATTLARLALKLGITISSNESVSLPSGPNTGVILYSGGWNAQNSAPTIVTWIIAS